MENNNFINQLYVIDDYCFKNLQSLFIVGIITDIIKNEKYSTMMFKLMLIDTISKGTTKTREFEFDNTIYKNFVNLQNNIALLIANKGILEKYFKFLDERETNLPKVRDENTALELTEIEEKILFNLPLLYDEIQLVKNFIIESYNLKKKFALIDLHGVQKEEDVKFLFNFLFGKFDTYVTTIATDIRGKKFNEDAMNMSVIKEMIKKYTNIEPEARMNFLEKNFKNIHIFLLSRGIDKSLKSMTYFLSFLMKFGELCELPLIFTLQN